MSVENSTENGTVSTESLSISALGRNDRVMINRLYIYQYIGICGNRVESFISTVR
jgi:hypothetical protein